MTPTRDVVLCLVLVAVGAPGCKKTQTEAPAAPSAALPAATVSPAARPAEPPTTPPRDTWPKSIAEAALELGNTVDTKVTPKGWTADERYFVAEAAVSCCDGPGELSVATLAVVLDVKLGKAQHYLLSLRESADEEKGDPLPRLPGRREYRAWRRAHGKLAPARLGGAAPKGEWRAAPLHENGPDEEKIFTPRIARGGELRSLSSYTCGMPCGDPAATVAWSPSGRRLVWLIRWADMDGNGSSEAWLLGQSTEERRPGGSAR